MQNGQWTVLVAVPLYAASIFASIPLLVARPIAPITTVLFVLVGVAALACTFVWPRTQPRPQRLRRCLAVALLTPLGIAFLLPVFVCACIKVPMMANQMAAREYLASREYSAAAEKEPKDTYGGVFHSDTNGAIGRVWSDGPDMKDDKGKVSVVRSARSFEAAWQTNYGHSFLDTIQNDVRRLALVELVTLWGQLRGDIVWQVGRDGKLTAAELGEGR